MLNGSNFQNPVVAVVMTVFNAEYCLSKSIDSILSQNYSYFELIIVDDGSTDNTLQIIDFYASKDSRIKIILNHANEGVVRSRNRAILSISHSVRYIAILDADDIASAGRLEKQVAYLDCHPEIALLGGQARIINENDRVVGFRNYPVTYEGICRVITRYNPFVHSAVMIRRHVLDVVGLYNEYFVRCQDYELWLRIAAIYSVENMPEYLVDYRISSNQIKQKNLMGSLFFTQKIQATWIFNKKFFSLLNQILFLARFFLFLLPDDLSLWLFKKIFYRKFPDNF